MSAYYWVPISSEIRLAIGGYDGDNHKISGLVNNSSISYNFIGLFGYVGGSLKNIQIVNSYFSRDATGVGGIAGRLDSSSITNCSFDGRMTSGGNVGGIVGYSYWSYFSQCCNFAYINSVTSGAVGGIVGFMDGSYGGVKDSYNRGNINSNYVPNVGGIVGHVSGLGSSDMNKFSNCYNTGDISGSSYVGGIIGKNSGTYSFPVQNCFNLGLLTCSDSYFGAIGGGFNFNLSNCYYGGKCTSGGCTPSSYYKSTLDSDVKSQEGMNFLRFDFTNIWKFDTENNGNSGYPVFQWQEFEFEFLGSGTSSSPYIVNCENALRKMSNNVNSGVDTSAYFKQTADIYMSSDNFPSIGTSTNKFSGAYDGNNKTIYNLTTNGMGMFGYYYSTNTRQIKNVILKDLAINSTATYVGGLVGEYTQNNSGQAISNCSVEGYINSSGTYVGGLVGSSGTSDIRTFENCVFNGIIEGAGKNVGGMVGGVIGNYAPNTSKCKVFGMISSTNPTGNVGGLFGLLDYSGPGPSNATVEGIIKGEYNVGGLFGYVASNAPNASNMAVKAQIIAKQPSRAGAFIGESLKANCLTNCSFIGSSNVEIGLFAGSVSTGKITSGACYSQVNNRKGYTSGTYTGYTVVPNINDDLPMQNSLFSIAIGGQTSDYVINHLKSKGFTLVS